MQHFIIICEMFVVDVHVESKETIKTSFGTKDFGQTEAISPKKRSWQSTGRLPKNSFQTTRN